MAKNKPISHTNRLLSWRTNELCAKHNFCFPVWEMDPGITTRSF